MNKPKVFVLMATYNGEKYLETQIDSILNQKEVDVFLYVNDDRSTDKTVNILKKYSHLNNFYYSINEKNKGYTYNFLDLLFSIKDKEFDYCAFSDQDDFWQEDKLITAVNAIKEKKVGLYISNLYLADSNLNIYGKQNNEDISKCQRYAFLAENIAAGCTSVISKELYNSIILYYPRNILFHDYWVFLIALFTSSFYYDHEPHILYRQHDNNQVGGLKKKRTLKQRIASLVKRSKGLKKPKCAYSHLFQELLNGYRGLIKKEDEQCINLAANYKGHLVNKAKLLFSREIKRSRKNFSFKLRILFNRF